MVVYYYFIKIFLFFSIVRILVKFEPMQKHWLFLGVLYTLGVAFVSWVFPGGAEPESGCPLAGAIRAGGETAPRAVAAAGVPDLAGRDVRAIGPLFQAAHPVRRGVIFWTLLLLGILVVLF